MAPACAVGESKQIETFCHVLKRKLELLYTHTESTAFLHNQLPLKRIELELDLSFLRVEEMYRGDIGGWIGCDRGLK